MPLLPDPSPASAPPTCSVALAEDAADDLLYFARTNSATEFATEMSELSSRHKSSKCSILVSAVDPASGNTSTHYAAANGHMEVLRAAIQAVQTEGPDAVETVLSWTNLAGSTPLHYAAVTGHVGAAREIVQAVEGKAKSTIVRARNAAGRDAAFEAEAAGKDDMVNYLLGVLDEEDVRPAGASSEEQDVEAAECVKENELGDVGDGGKGEGDIN